MSKKISARKQLPKPDAKGFVKITQRQFEELKASMFNEVVNEVSEDAIAKVMLTSVYILANDFGKLIRRKNRFQNFAKLFREYCEIIDRPTEAMLMAEAEFKAKTNMEFIKD